MQRIHRYFDQETLENVATLDHRLYSWSIHNEYYFTGDTKFKRLLNVRCSNQVVDLSPIAGVHILDLGWNSKVTDLHDIEDVYTLNLGWNSKVTDLQPIAGFINYG